MWEKLSLSQLNRLSEREFSSISKFRYSFLLDNIRSLNNVGSIFRTLDAFLGEKIYLCGITGIPPHKEIHKTALGAENTVMWEYHQSALNILKGIKKEGIIIVGIEQVKESILLQNFTFDSNFDYLFVFGNEVEGIQEDVLKLCDFCIEIPQFGTKHSLNVSVTAGIVAWEFIRKIKNKK